MNFITENEIVCFQFGQELVVWEELSQWRKKKREETEGKIVILSFFSSKVFFSDHMLKLKIPI